MADAPARQHSLFYELHIWEPFVMRGKAPPDDPAIFSTADRTEALAELRKKHVQADEMECYYLTTPEGKFIWLDKQGHECEGSKLHQLDPAP